MNWNQELEYQLSRINFEGIHQYMKLVGWKYREEKESPTVSDLKSTVSMLFWTAFSSFEKTEKNTPSRASTGGFSVVILKWEHSERPCVEITFDISKERTNVLDELRRKINNCLGV